MQASPDADPATKNAGTESYSWVVRLSEREPWKRWVVLGVAILAALIGILLMNSVVFGLIGFIAILAATTDFWLPLKYRIDNEGCTMRCGFSVSAIEWEKVKRLVYDEEGVKVSPLEEESRLSPFRGIYLRFAGNREQVVEAITRLGGEYVANVGQGTDGGGDARAHPEGRPGDSQEKAGDAGGAHAGDA